MEDIAPLDPFNPGRLARGKKFQGGGDSFGEL